MPTSVIPASLWPTVHFLERHGARILRVTSLTAVVLALLSLALPLPDTASGDAAVVSLRVTDRSGQLLREVRPDGRSRPVRLGDVDPAVVDALLAVEDRRFWWHPGVDPVAVARAAWSNLASGVVVSGASTITMQVARLLRDPAGTGRRGWTNKLREAHLALRLELRWSKTRILETWLNRVSFGNRARGIEAAARLYFDKAAVDLNRAEAAFLVGLPQSPSRYNPFRNLPRARDRQHRVLAAMERAGHLTPADRRHLHALPLELRDRTSVFRAPHFTEWVLQSADSLTGAEEVRTTLDARLQSAVEGLVRGRVRMLDSESVTNAAALVLDNRSGDVLAYVGSADFWNARIGGQNDGVQMLRQPGSTLKPFTYGRALQSGDYTAASVLPDVELQVPEAGGAFSPTNYDDRYHGPTPLRTALASSYNVPAVRLAREMGAARLLGTLHDAGFTSLNRPPAHYGVGLTLGNGEVRLLELARAYAGLARGGTLPAVRGVQWQRTPAGDTLHASPPPPEPMGLTPGVVHVLRDVLSDPEARAPAFGRGGPLELPFPTAAKTGTSKDFRDNWTVGFTPRHTVAVWVGNFDGSPMRRVSGVSGAGPLFHSIVREIGASGSFPRPAALTAAVVCPASGQRPGAFCPAPRSELFLPGTTPADTCSVHRRLRIDTRSGLRAHAGTPDRFVQAKVFTAYPEVYHPWMRAHDVPLPPPVTTSPATADASTTAPASNPSSPGDDASRRAPGSGIAANGVTDRLQVHYPVDGTHFVADPVLRSDYQRLHLRGAAPTTWRDVHWTIDGERLDGPYTEAVWPLESGTHVLTLHAVTSGGRSVHSRPATLHVHDVPRQPAWTSREAVPLR